MIDARKQKFGKVITDFIFFLPWSNFLVRSSLLVCLIFLVLLISNDSLSFEYISKIGDHLFSANLTIMGVDMAALAILFALFQDKQLSTEAKKAFKEQCGAFLLNAVGNLLAIVLFVICTFLATKLILYVTFFFQIWAILLVFEVVIELFTLVSTIINK